MDTAPQKGRVLPRSLRARASFGMTCPRTLFLVACALQPGLGVGEKGRHKPKHTPTAWEDDKVT